MKSNFKNKYVLSILNQNTIKIISYGNVSISILHTKSTGIKKHLKLHPETFMKILKYIIEQLLTCNAQSKYYSKTLRKKNIGIKRI